MAENSRKNEFFERESIALIVMLTCQNHHHATGSEIGKFTPDVMLDIQPLLRRIKMYRHPFTAVIKNEIAAAGSTDDHLFKFAVGMPAANGIPGCPVDVVYPFDVKREVIAFFQRDQTAVMIPVNIEF